MERNRYARFWGVEHPYTHDQGRDHLAGAYRRERSLGELPLSAKDISAAVSIFEGTDQIIHDALGLRPGRSLKQISTCRSLCNSPLPDSFSPEIITMLFEQVVGNWRGHTPSRKPSYENWRHERRIEIADQNKSPEVILERAIATLAELGDLPGWYNQIPVASGLVDGRSDKRAALDLARVDGDIAELIELKWASDTPLFALFEVLRYGLALLLSRQNAERFDYVGRPLIDAAELRFVVLAPAQYYANYNLACFAEVVNSGLCDLSRQHPNFPPMSLGFFSFPAGFELPFECGEQVNAMRVGGESVARTQLLSAVNSLQPVGAIVQ